MQLVKLLNIPFCFLLEELLPPSRVLLSLADLLCRLTLRLPFDNMYHPMKQPAAHSVF